MKRSSIGGSTFSSSNLAAKRRTLAGTPRPRSRDMNGLQRRTFHEIQGFVKCAFIGHITTDHGLSEAVGILPERFLKSQRKDQIL